MMDEKELSEAVDLCLDDGRLNPQAVGWSRRPLQRCNLRGRWPRKKRWNYWALTSESHLFSVTVSHVDYVGLVFIYVADFEQESFNEVTQMVPFGRGIALPETVGEDVRFEAEGLRVAMRQVEGGVELAVELANFEGLPLSAEIAITKPENHETLNVVIPWDERTFQFTSKQNTLPAQGTVRFGSETITFGGDQSFACLDFGRGIWPRDCKWNWGSASGTQGGHVIGLNLGGQWTDGTGYTENGICIDGRLTKISEELRWEYDKKDFMGLWRIASPSGAIDLYFQPIMERVARSDLWQVKSEVHQLFGHYSGTVRTAAGQEIAVDGLLGWAEDHVALW